MLKKYNLFLETLNGKIVVDEVNSRPNSNYMRLVSMIDDTEIGSIEYSWLHNHIGHLLHKEGELYIAYTKAHIRGHRIGIKLVKRAILEARKLGLSFVSLMLPNDGSDTSGLEKMYFSIGFKSLIDGKKHYMYYLL